MKKIFLILSILGIIGISGYFYFRQISYAPKIFIIEKDILGVIKKEIFKKEDIGTPIIIRIPKLKINTNIESIALAKTNTMDVAKNFTNVGWYKLAFKPGEIGTAVIDGHFGWKKSIAGIFNDLDKLVIGDEIYIEDENKQIFTFIVKASKIYNEFDDTEEVFNSSDGKSHLNLISCYGPWDKKKKAYHSRLVIFTERK